MNNKVLVTGGAGYIGSVFVPQLLATGYKVTVLDNFMYKQDSLLDVCYHPNLEIIPGDVRDTDLLKKEIEKHDIIIPLAAIVGARACDRDKSLAKEINQTQVENIAGWVVDEQMVLFPVTNSGYGIGQKGKYCDETTPLNPISHYGRKKVNAEKALLDMGNAVTFRLATVFGTAPRMRMDLLVNDFVYRAYKDRFIVLFESHFKRNYIHIRDIASVFLHAVDNYAAMKGKAYNVGLSDANFSKRELCDKIREHIPDFHIFESEIGKDPDKRNYMVSNKKIEDTGWVPKYNIDDGIRELIKMYQYLKVSNYQN
ncbi:MAG: NAD(P)-dependent oxidoreductase [Candidatus Marinimicrobia bacterium]|nr:NAD(P)-dependent oxidoreductase [Candidatus Neomarinimicrobiota bacterium]